MDKRAASIGLFTLLLLPLGGCGEKEGASEGVGVEVVQVSVADSDEQVMRLTTELEEAKARLAAAEQQLGELLEVVEERLPGFEAKRAEAKGLQEEVRTAVDTMERGEAEAVRCLQEAINGNEEFKKMIEMHDPIGLFENDPVGAIKSCVEKMMELEAENAELSEQLREKGEALEGGVDER